MAGTKAGGKKTRATTYAKYGRDHYKKIGALDGIADNGNTHKKGYGSKPYQGKQRKVINA